MTQNPSDRTVKTYQMKATASLSGFFSPGITLRGFESVAIPATITSAGGPLIGGEQTFNPKQEASAAVHERPKSSVSQSEYGNTKPE